MQILSHRGLWTHPDEKNSLAAFERSLSAGFGIETDFRDLGREIVISHDPPDAGAIRAAEFFALYRRHQQPGLPLALNIKADGLQGMLKPMLAEYGISNYFVFDMSIPDTLNWARANVPYFARQSDHEPEPVCYGGAAGIWLDEFDRHWIDEEVIRRHISCGKQVCVVSPELHGRPHLPVWEEYRTFQSLIAHRGLILCTDFPEQAHAFFC